MTGRVEDYERATAFADIALGQMKALRQNATPRNYEIWYAYASGYHPALNPADQRDPQGQGQHFGSRLGPDL
jgi:hypothetical protein